MKREVVIDCFPESARKYDRRYAVVAVDVIRATTTAVTAASAGRECYTVESLETAWEVAAGLQNPLLAGELGGDMPEGFEISNSPTALLACSGDRPVVLLSTSGTRLIYEARGSKAVFLACFRNFSFTAQYLADRYRKIAVIGAGSRGEFREEDQMCCAWIAERLEAAGYATPDSATRETIERWRGARPEACASGNSAKYLRRSSQSQDLDFVLDHFDDLESVVEVRGRKIVETLAGFERSYPRTPALAPFTAGGLA